MLFVVSLGGSGFRRLYGGLEVRHYVREMRSEADVLSDLAAICRSDGYVHALAYLCFRDSVVRYTGEMCPKDVADLFERPPHSYGDINACRPDDPRRHELDD